MAAKGGLVVLHRAKKPTTDLPPPPAEPYLNGRADEEEDEGESPLVLDAYERAMTKDDAGREAMLLETLTELTAETGNVDAAFDCAYTLVGVLKAMGLCALSRHQVVRTLQTPLESKKSQCKENVLLCVQLLFQNLGPAFMPYSFPLISPTFKCCGDGGKTVNEAGKAAIEAMVQIAKPHDVRLILPSMTAALEDRAWKVKEFVLLTLASLSREKSLKKAMADCLPSVCGLLRDTCQDTHPKVSQAAKDALKGFIKTVDNRETQKLREEIFLALVQADLHTNECLDKLMETTFVNAIGAPSLALIVPILLRGLRERASDIVKKGCQTCTNVFGLVRDPLDLCPFVPALMPELKKAANHSNPDVREKADQAMTVITTTLEGEESDAQEKRRQTALFSAQAKVFAAIPRVENYGPLLNQEVSGYVATVASTIVLDPDVGNMKSFEKKVKDALSEILAGVAPGGSSDEEKLACGVGLCEGIIGALASTLKEQTDGRDDFDDYLLNMKGIILAFAGKVLLRRTNLLIRQGRCYGFVGQNGVGKTTLLTRIAAGDIDGFPEGLKCYYVRHEILAEAGEGVFDFMTGQVPAGTSDEKVREALYAVGFDEEKQKAPVNDLSGGWRMKLAIARSMMWEPELLILDEPTNHLDHASVQWLAEYVKGVTGKCTVLLVSHDYDFLQDVLTDVVHIAEQRLTYYAMSFREFQKQNPQICAGLPSPGSTISQTVQDMKQMKVSASQQSLSEMSEGTVDSESTAGGMSRDTSTNDLLSLAERKDLLPIVFPDPGRLDGIRGKTKPVMRLKSIQFTYPGAAKSQLTDASVTLTMGSRCAVLGKNGAGKTTLMRIIIGELEADEGKGEFWKHHNLRVAYVAQHSMHHLEDSKEISPAAYIQKRFFMGRDRELAKMSTIAITDDEKEIMKERGKITGITGRQERGKQLWYSCTKCGRDIDDVDWLPLLELQCKEPYVMKLVRNYDEELKVCLAEPAPVCIVQRYTSASLTHPGLLS